mmetsp:Transcript_117225/g.227924  ORF Transcript_117225/g.227924 Transcript_117225/m.227924 type:complete len:80 (+) Transcript_117225:276-515(+)
MSSMMPMTAIMIMLFQCYLCAFVYMCSMVLRLTGEPWVQIVDGNSLMNLGANRSLNGTFGSKGHCYFCPETRWWLQHLR